MTSSEDSKVILELLERLKVKHEGAELKNAVYTVATKKQMDSLLEKWKTLKEYKTAKSHRGRPDGSDEERYGEATPTRILGILPRSLADFLLHSSFELRYDNGARGNSYNAITNVATIKSTHDLLHEIGHGLWYNLIPQTEDSKRRAVINSLSNDRTKRLPLPEGSIPKMHKAYGLLVGAYSGQFLAETENQSSAYRNDLEEHFARNIDYLIKGKPLIALPSSPFELEEFLWFYKTIGITDEEFDIFYQQSITRFNGGNGLQKLHLEETPLGDDITTPLIFQILDIRRELYASQGLTQESGT